MYQKCLNFLYGVSPFWPLKRNCPPKWAPHNCLLLHFLQKKTEKIVNIFKQIFRDFFLISYSKMSVITSLVHKAKTYAQSSKMYGVIMKTKDTPCRATISRVF